MWIWLLLLSAFAFSLPRPGFAVESVSSKAGSDAPVGTSITSKKMTVKNQDSQAIFEGSVVLTRGTLTVYSDHMIVFFRPADSNGSDERKGRGPGKGAAPSKGPDAVPAVSNRSVNQIEATGRVKIEKESGRATCEKAVYFHDGDKIVLTGDPVAWEKGTRVSGKQITMFLAEDRSVVEGSSHVRIEPDGGAGK